MVTSTDGREWRVEQIACPLCGSERAVTAMRKRGRLIPHAFSIVRCSACGLAYVNPRIGEDEIPLLYDEAYYRGDGFDASIDYAGAGDERLYRSVVDSLEVLLGGLRGRSILDVGCGNGALVLMLGERGANAAGIDTSERAIELARARGANATLASIDAYASPRVQFDAATVVEVIEHVPHPVEFLRAVARVVRPGGYVFATTGNWSFVRWEPGTPYVMPEGHLAYYTPPTLARAFTLAGLEAVTAPWNRTWIGWRLGASEKLARVVQRVASAWAPFPVARVR